MSSVSKGLEIASDVLQYAMPAYAWLADTAPDIYNNNFEVALKKTLIIGGLILVQNQTVKCLKNHVKKERPNHRNLESFPSGHMMIATQSAVRLLCKYGFFSQAGALAVSGAAAVAVGRYLPGQHDIVDLTAGGFLGSLLGAAWNTYIT